ncbi:ATP-binding protein [Halorussus sp. AFM4]|uniref:ATP-binding protein n=1 Tax=Halorussus sp. AFM4 TaxID=3421651 RepID=UPI003EBA7EBC
MNADTLDSRESPTKDTHREYIRVTPSTETLDQQKASDQIASLHGLQTKTDSTTGGFLGKLQPESWSQEPIEFEFLAFSQGEEEPVELFYGATARLQTLENRLLEIYPSSFTIERVEFDIGKRLVKPVKFSRYDFQQHLRNGNLWMDYDDLVEAEDLPDRSPDDSEKDTTESDGSKSESEASDGQPTSRVRPSGTTSPPSGELERNVPSAIQARRKQELLDTEASNLPELRSPQSSLPETPEKNLPDTYDDPEKAIDPARKVRFEDGVVILDPPEKIPDDEPIATLDRPTLAEDGNIYARPAASETYPHGARWRGKGARKHDWMTTLRTANLTQEESGRANTGNTDEAAPVLSSVFNHLMRAKKPMAFQVLFRPKPDWSGDADSRKHDLKNGRDTLGQSVMTDLLGTDRDVDDDAELPDDVSERIDQLSNKLPRRTFDVNIRAVSVASLSQIGERQLPTGEPRTDDEETMIRSLDELLPTLDQLDGKFYEIDGVRVDRQNARLSQTPSSHRLFERVLNRELVTRDSEGSVITRSVSSGRVRPEVVANPSELCALAVTPSGSEMQIDAFRGTHTKQQADSPLTLPEPELLQKYDVGMNVGIPLDNQGEPVEEPVSLPERLLPLHYARFASTGAGKSVAIIQDMLSLNENVGGPTILIDPKGDGMSHDYMQSHYAQEGDLDDVYFFRVPEMIPGVPFFDIRPALEAGKDRQTAIQNKINHFHAIMEMVMGEEEYNAAYVALDILSFLITSLFDGEHGYDAFRLDDLYEAARKMQQEERIPRSSDPNRDIEATLSRHSEKPDKDFQQSMSAVLSRLEKVKQNAHLYRMLNYVPEWDAEKGTYAEDSPVLSFQDFLEEDVVLLVDLGELRDVSKHAVTMVLLSQLWDSVQERRRDGKTDYEGVVNLIIEEAAPVAATELVYNQLLPKARSFGLSMGLVMQYPSQVREESNRAYNEILNEIHTKLIGPIESEPDLGEVLEFEGQTAQEMRNRITSLPRGQWVVSLPSPLFGDRSPVPFSLQAMPIPQGHPESEAQLKEAAKQRFERAEMPRCKKRTQRHLAIDDQLNTQPVKSTAEQSTQPTEPISESPDSASSESRETGPSIAATSSDSDSSNDSDNASLFQNSKDLTFGEEDREVEGTNDEAAETGASEGEIADETPSSPPELPEHVTTTEGGAYRCTICGRDYSDDEVGRADASSCCTYDNVEGLLASARGLVLESDEEYYQRLGRFSDHADTRGVDVEMGELKEALNADPDPNVSSSEPEDDDSSDSDVATEESLDVGLKANDDIPDDVLEEKGLSQDDVEFLRTVVKAMNGRLEGYSLHESMRSLKSDFTDIHLDQLTELGFLEKSRAARKVYYTVLPEGREFVNASLAVGEGQGDLGEKTPHKVGVELLYQYLSNKKLNNDAKKYYEQDEKTVFDVAAFSTKGDIQKVAEVETESNNPEAVVEDYEKMAESDAPIAIWVFDNRDTAAHVVEALHTHGLIEDEIPSSATQNSTVLKEYISDHDLPGMTEIWTLTQLYDEVKDDLA